MLYLRYLHGLGQSRIMSRIFSRQRKFFKSNLTPKVKLCLSGLIMTNNFEAQRKSFKSHWTAKVTLCLTSLKQPVSSVILSTSAAASWLKILWYSLKGQGKSERTSFTWIVLTLCNLEDSCHSTCPTWSDIPPWKVLPPKKDLLGTHLVADFPPDTIVEPIIRISVARIGGQVQLVHLGEGQTIVLTDLAHKYVCYMSLRSG